MATGTPESSWTEYSPGPYALNRQVLSTLTVQLRDEQGTTPATSETLLVVVARLAPRVKDPPEWRVNTNTTDGDYVGLKVKTTDGDYVIECDPFCRNLLEILFTLSAKGGNALSSMWFYYDRDDCPDMPDSAHCFFVVDYDRIILPRAALYGVVEFVEDFRPDVLISLKERIPNPMWASQVDEPIALSRVWYPRFYTQTIEGQLMVASDYRPLFFFARPPQAEVNMGEMRQARDDHQELLGRLDRIGTSLTWLIFASVISAIALLVRLFR